MRKKARMRERSQRLSWTEPSGKVYGFWLRPEGGGGVHGEGGREYGLPDEGPMITRLRQHPVGKGGLEPAEKADSDIGILSPEWVRIRARSRSDDCRSGREELEGRRADGGGKRRRQ